MTTARTSPAHPSSPLQVTRQSFATRDTATACAFLSVAYACRVAPLPEAAAGAGALAGAVALRHGRLDGGAYQLDEVALDGALAVEPDLDHQVLIVQARRGEAATTPGCPLDSGRPFVTAPATAPHRLAARSAVLEVTALTVPLLRRTAPYPLDRQPVHVRFTSAEAGDAEGERLWRSTCAYARSVLLTTTTAVPPLLVAETGRMLAAVALAVFPNNLTGLPYPADGLDADGLDADATPDALRRAMVFIEENAHADIGLGHVAAAAHVTPRALQYAFRRHAGTTPLAHLRAVRLERAHQELLAAEPSLGATVTAVAARWGFAHMGRFAAAYRGAYGVHPSVTLHA
ncbi:helix-turn-helix domain-containing protein [Streptomyces antimicrobicus]|uniref:Helix-turn-helix domain-containing protein n=1 Tax=Streptomyces antimicrobicus TaxID=2883108 RepID=A0ABS8B2E8_9ACTN|nr:helix-turn-helix domain-containing protein [Streptomyces antimicrobicus]MCB5178771.1 helix-turn-helix domain-containing protein [Streptomyces antimicrobicus]